MKVTGTKTYSRLKFTTLTGSDPLKQPSKKPNKPWADRKKRQILEGKRTDAEIETDNDAEIARWQRKKEEN